MIQGTSGGDGVVGVREVVVYVCRGGMLDNGVDRRFTYVGGEYNMYVDFANDENW